MNIKNFEKADRFLFRLLDKCQVHFLYWTIIILVVKLLS